VELVTVKTKYQIVIPQSIRKKAGVDVGDLLEAKVENGKITFSPKSVVDRHSAEGLDDLKHGRTHGRTDPQRKRSRLLRPAPPNVRRKADEGSVHRKS
jgi:AbrB family looped-hinge helix DNA binding protein